MARPDPNYNLIAGIAFVALAGLVIFLYYWLQRKPRGAYEVIPREKMIGILKHIDKTSFALLQRIATLSQQFAKEQGEKLTYEECEDFIAEEGCLDEHEIYIERSCTKFGVPRKDFQDCLEDKYSRDKEIQALRATHKTELENAIQGIRAEVKTKIDTALTAEKTLEVTAKLMRETLKRMRKAFNDLRVRGVNVDMENEEVTQAIASCKLDDLKETVLKSFGLDKFEDAADKIIQSAIDKYALENKDGFRDALNELNQKNQMAMQAIVIGEENMNKMIQSVRTKNDPLLVAPPMVDDDDVPERVIPQKRYRPVVVDDDDVPERVIPQKRNKDKDIKEHDE
jgi:hypothetical protein